MIVRLPGVDSRIERRGSYIAYIPIDKQKSPADATGLFKISCD